MAYKIACVRPFDNLHFYKYRAGNNRIAERIKGTYLLKRKWLSRFGAYGWLQIYAGGRFTPIGCKNHAR